MTIHVNEKSENNWGKFSSHPQESLKGVDVFLSAAEVCSLFCPSWGETPTESPLSSSQRRKTPGQPSKLNINVICQSRAWAVIYSLLTNVWW